MSVRKDRVRPGQVDVVVGFVSFPQGNRDMGRAAEGEKRKGVLGAFLESLDTWAERPSRAACRGLCAKNREGEGGSGERERERQRRRGYVEHHGSEESKTV
jgi:hypothetical protein